MELRHQAQHIDLLDLRTAPMRAFHMTWAAFFLCFFGWFSVAPLMAVVRDDLGLTREQIGNTMIASVAVTVIVRLLIGPLCDRVGPRRLYTALLVLGAIPVASIGLANDYSSFLLCRLAIGTIGAAFVLTQFHTSMMFSPRIVATANATTAGWGNLGGGVTQMAMPLVFAAIVGLGVAPERSWRLAMLVPAALMIVAGLAYARFTTDAPDGNFTDLRRRGELAAATKGGGLLRGFGVAARDFRSWALFLAYGACFGIELTIHNVAALYFVDRFGLDLARAGLVAGSFGAMALFARMLGGWLSDRLARRAGLAGRVQLLFVTLLLEGIALVAFSRMNSLPLAIALMLAFALFLQMSCGATFGIVPFVNRSAVGAVSGIVGAGGNAVAIAAGFLLRVESLRIEDALFHLGVAVILAAPLVAAVHFSAAESRRHVAETGPARVADPVAA